MEEYYKTRHVFVRRAYYWCPSKHEIGICRQISIKIRNKEFNENASGGLGSDTCGRADKRAEAKILNSHFFGDSAYKRSGTAHVILESNRYSD
jgi:hypothetical protein